jgi:translocation and assembly module TamB
MDIGQLRWQGARQQIEATQIHLDWSPSALLQGRLDIAELSIAALHITTTPSQTPTPAPTDLQLPLTVNAKKLSILKLSVDDGFTATDLAASFSSDGRQHQLYDVHGLTGGIAVTGAPVSTASPPCRCRQRRDFRQLDERTSARPDRQRPAERIALTAVATQASPARPRSRFTPSPTPLSPAPASSLKTSTRPPGSPARRRPNSASPPTSHRKATASSAASA